MNSKSPKRREQVERRGGDLGADPVAREDGDAMAHPLAISFLETGLVIAVGA